MADSGAADSHTLARWISETEAKRATAAAQLRTRQHLKLSRTEIAAAVDAVGDIADTLSQAPSDKRNKLYRAVGVRMTYHSVQRKVLVEISPDQHSVGERFVSEGGLEPLANGPWASGELQLP